MSTDPRALFERLVRTGEIIDLSHEIHPGIPIHPFHHQYSLTLQRRHGETVRAGGASFANEVIVTPGHVGTHIDALGHFSRNGCLHGGLPVAEVETHAGLQRLDVAEIPPLWHRGVFLDAARVGGVDCLAPGDSIEAEMLAECVAESEVAIEPKDIVLVRTGWARHWEDPATYESTDGCPGVGPAGARWLIDRKVAVVGSDTAAFEVYPQRGESVHALLLVDAGVQIIENLDLEQLRDRGRAEFLFVALPLRLVGATGCPIRPIAVL